MMLPTDIFSCLHSMALKVIASVLVRHHSAVTVGFPNRRQLFAVVSLELEHPKVRTCY